MLGLAVGLSRERLRNALRHRFGTTGWVTLARERADDLITMLDEQYDLVRLVAEQRDKIYNFGDLLAARAGSRATAVRAGAAGRRVEDEIQVVAERLGLPYALRTRFAGRNGRTAACDLVIPDAKAAVIAVAAKGFDSTGSKLTDAVRGWRRWPRFVCHGSSSMPSSTESGGRIARRIFAGFTTSFSGSRSTACTRWRCSMSLRVISRSQPRSMASGKHRRGAQPHRSARSPRWPGRGAAPSCWASRLTRSCRLGGRVPRRDHATLRGSATGRTTARSHALQGRGGQKDPRLRNASGDSTKAPRTAAGRMPRTVAAIGRGGQGARPARRSPHPRPSRRWPARPGTGQHRRTSHRYRPPGCSRPAVAVCSGMRCYGALVRPEAPLRGHRPGAISSMAR